MGEKNILRIKMKPKFKNQENFYCLYVKFKQGNCYIKLVGPSESLVGLSDLGSNLPCLTTWVGPVMLSPDTVNTYPIIELNSSVVPNASNMSSSFALLSPVKVEDLPTNSGHSIMTEGRREGRNWVLRQNLTYI